MNSETDYYAILGVLPSIDQGALTAVYRALLKKHHPDMHAGDKENAHRITRRIIEAYEVLGNAASRAEYDRLRQDRGAYSGDFDDDDGQSDDGPEMEDERLDAAWLYIETYYPEAEQHRQELAELSSALALSYQVTLVETKAAAEAEDLADALRHQFLERYFGSNPDVQELAVEALRRKRRDVALEINQAIKFLGSPRPAETDHFIETVKRVTQWEGQRTFARHRSAGGSDRRGYRLSRIDLATLAAVFSIGALVLAYMNAI
jgi:curved DNA-binding protein CbpA